MFYSLIKDFIVQKYRIDNDAVTKRVTNIKQRLINENHPRLVLFVNAALSGNTFVCGLIDLIILTELLDIEIKFCKELKFLNPFFGNSEDFDIEVVFSNKKIKIFDRATKTIRIKNSIEVVIRKIKKMLKKINFLPFYTPQKVNFKRLKIKENLGKIIPTNEYNGSINSLYDIDGVSFSVDIDKLEKHLKTEIFVNINEQKKPISKYDFVWNKKFTKIKTLSALYIGNTYTEIGALNIFLITDILITEVIAALKMAILSIKNDSPAINNMIMSVSETIKLHTKPEILKILLKDLKKSYIYIERFGQKDHTISDCMYDLLVKINNSIDITGLYWIKFDLCETFYIPNPIKTCTTLDISNFTNFPIKVYKILKDENIANAHGATWKVQKGRLEIYSRGIEKMNVYTKLVGYFFNESIMKKKVPPFTLSKVIQNFYGYKFKYKSKVENLRKQLQTILEKENYFPMIPIRFEIKTSGFNFIDFKEYTNIFIKKAKFHTKPISEIKSLIEKTIQPLLNILNTSPKTINEFYDLLLLEIFIREFFITGSCNLHCLDSEAKYILQNLSLSDINEFSHFATFGSMASTIFKLLESEKRIKAKDLDVISRVCALINTSPCDIPELIVKQYSSEIKKVKQKDDDRIVYTKNYIKETFGSSESYVFSAMYNFVRQENILNEYYLNSKLEENLKVLCPHVLEFKTNKLVKHSDYGFDKRELVDQLENVKINIKKGIKWNEDEKIRLLHGLSKFSIEKTKYSLLKNDFSYGFGLTRTNINLKDAERVIMNNTEKLKELSEKAQLFDVTTFDLAKHVEYMKEFGLYLNDKEIEIYNTILKYDLKKNHNFEKSVEINIDASHSQPDLESIINFDFRKEKEFETELEFETDIDLDFISE